jgi:hypothetical protein
MNFGRPSGRIMQPSVTAIRSHTKPSIRFLSNIIHFFLVTLSKKFRTILKCNNLHVNNLKALLARIDQFPVEYLNTVYSLSKEHSTKIGQFIYINRTLHIIFRTETAARWPSDKSCPLGKARVSAALKDLHAGCISQGANRTNRGCHLFSMSYSTLVQ